MNLNQHSHHWGAHITCCKHWHWYTSILRWFWQPWHICIYCIYVCTHILIYIYIGWWFQPLWKILASWDYYSHIYIYIWKNKTCSKPPTRYVILYIWWKTHSVSTGHWLRSTYLLRQKATLRCKAPGMWRSVLRQNISDRLTRGLFSQGFAGEMSIFSFCGW